MLSKLSRILSWKLIFVLIFINLAILDYLAITGINSFVELKNQILKNASIVLPEIEQVKPSVISTPATDESCSLSCITKINEAMSSLKLSSPTSKIVPTSPLNNTPQFSSQVKEFFIPFGSGTNSTDDWADVSGLAATIDTTQYNQIKSAYFEVSLRIPTGNEKAYARLYNATDKHPVWFSDVSIEGGTPQLVISNPIILDAGKKLYQVQMKTSLKYPALIDQARVHINTY
ncbi:MAG: hypothetical protein ABH816_02240 [Candidatus Levyibacteriota bacterium]